MRLRIDLAYDGAAFHGWASQPGLRTVQGAVEDALATVLRLPSVAVTCAGRTDAGVHARGQVAHADVPGGSDGAAPLDAALVDGLPRRLDGVLEEDVRVRGVGVAPPGFDARFSALWRRYAYRVRDEPGTADPLLRGHVLDRPRRLDLESMNAAAVGLLGEHDFAAFCRRREGASTVRELLDLAWSRDAAGLAVLDVRAGAFCHQMVRSLAGCLMAVGEGRREPAWAASLLTAGARASEVAVAPAHGLCLEEVGYPAPGDVEAQAARTRRRRA